MRFLMTGEGIGRLLLYYWLCEDVEEGEGQGGTSLALAKIGLYLNNSSRSWGKKK